MKPLTIATINAANLGEWSNAERIHNLARSIIEDLHAPMILAVQELGGLFKEGETVVRASVADTIIHILREEFQQTYQYAEVAPLPDSTGGAEELNIRCGFFYHSSIELKKVWQIGGDSEFFIGDEAKENVASRLPLVGLFQHEGVEVYVINCHLKSMSIKEQTKKQAKKQRNRQAQYIASYIQAESLMEKPLLVVGDMNDTYASKTVQALVSQGFNSAHALLNYQIYTYKHHKKPILLDYILYNGCFKDIESSIVHINTDSMSDRSYSDHDPIMMTCHLC